MPTVAFLDGIKTEIYFKDHVPPHIYATSAGDEVLVVIEDASIYAGSFPKRKLSKVIDYVTDPKNKTRLMKLWKEYGGS
jgi:hypothetical protein